MAQVLKKCTGLTGLAVDPMPHRSLVRIYEKCLRVINKLPEDYVYRQRTEKLIQDRMNIVKTTPNIKEVEEKIGMGQAEELYIQAENEMNLARNMLQWKPWESLIQQEPPKQWAWPPHK